MIEEKAKIIPQHKVPCLITISLREIIKLFRMDGKSYTYCITKLKANASNIEKNTPLIDDSDYGIVGYLDRHMDSFTMDYEIKWDEDGKPANPINNTGISRIENGLRKVGLEDAAVEYLRVLIKDPEIGLLAGISEDLFHTTLISDPADSNLDRDIIKEHPVNEALIKDCGFKYRILHTRELIDRKSELTLPKSQLLPKYLIRWTGNTIHSLRSPIKVAQRLREHFGEYRLIKTYGAGTEDILVLIGVER